MNEKLIGKTVGEADMRKQYGLNIIAIGMDGKIATDIEPNYTFGEKDIIVVVGKKENISAFEMD